MLLRKAHVDRLDPPCDQAAVLGQWVGAKRFVDTLALEQRRDWGRPGRSFKFASPCREVTALRAEVDWLLAVPVHALQQPVKDFDRAYQTWWAGRGRAPTPRRRGIHDTMRLPDPTTFEVRRLSRHSGEVKRPKLGWVRLRWDRSVPGTVKNLTVSHRTGLWQVAAPYEREIAEPAPCALPVVGIDRGMAVFGALSDGTLIAPASHGTTTLKALKRAQRKLARTTRGSNNRRQQARRVARPRMRVANARRDVLQKHAPNIAQNHGVVVVEKLEVRNMVRSAAGRAAAPGRNVWAKPGLNRAILDPGWGMVRTMLGWKLTERGGRLVKVPARDTSRTSAACGAVDGASRRGQRFCCTACGHQAQADVNAAIEIRRQWDTPSLPMEALRWRSAEAGTRRRAA